MELLYFTTAYADAVAGIGAPLYNCFDFVDGEQ